MMQIERARAFYLPDGSYIKAETFGGGVNANETDDRHWKSLDLHLIRPDGQDILFCGIEYEDGIGLRTLLFDAEHDEPIHEQVVLKAEELK